MIWPWLVNACYPGAGLILRDRLVLGLAFAVPALVVVALALLLALLATPDFRTQVLAVLAGCYLALAILAGLVGWLTERRRPVDAGAVNRAFVDTARALLADPAQPARALTAAREVARLAPAHPGAWRLVALTAHRDGQPATAQRATARANHLVRRSLA